MLTFFGELSMSRLSRGIQLVPQIRLINKCFSADLIKECLWSLQDTRMIDIPQFTKACSCLARGTVLPGRIQVVIYSLPLHPSKKTV